MTRREALRPRLLAAAALSLAAASACRAGTPSSVPAAGRQPRSDRPDDLTIWPNRESFRNSDPWLAQNHERIRALRPRVLVLNFANDVDMAHMRAHTEGIVRALAESSRYHGFEDAAAPAFLQYEVVKYVDLRDEPVPPDRAGDNSSLFPVKPGADNDVLCDYAGFYTDEFAERLGFPDPDRPSRCLDLHELIEAGVVHELWFHAIHAGAWPGLEVAELKQRYDEQLARIEGQHVPAGNGHDETMPWSGRTFRIAFINPHRGIGCALENFGHGLEATAASGAIPDFQRDFARFSDSDLGARFGVPFDSLYAVGNEPLQVDYPSQDVAEVRFEERRYRLAPFVAAGGNVHFPPGARHHYDTQSPHTVPSTIESFGLRNGPDGTDGALPFSAEKFHRYDEFAPDCMGAWTVFWRQCMPGLRNPCVDDAGSPMKNWWVFLFY